MNTISLVEARKLLDPKKGRSRFAVAAKAERTVDGVTFDSKREMNRYLELKLLERAGEVQGLVLQPKFPVSIEGEPFCTYRADFAFFRDGERIVEDVKSSGTAKDAAYRLRKKAAELAWGISVVEIIG